MRRPYRLTQRSDIRRVQQRGQTYRGMHISVRMFQSKHSTSRFAFSIRREAGNAVTRNLIRRRLREICRSLNVACGWDVIVSAQPGAAKAGFGNLAKDVQNTFSRAGLLGRGAP